MTGYSNNIFRFFRILKLSFLKNFWKKISEEFMSYITQLSQLQLSEPTLQ